MATLNPTRPVRGAERVHRCAICSRSSRAVRAAGRRRSAAAPAEAAAARFRSPGGPASRCARPMRGSSSHVMRSPGVTSATKRSVLRAVTSSPKSTTRRLRRRTTGSRGGANSWADRASTSPFPNIGTVSAMPKAHNGMVSKNARAVAGRGTPCEIATAIPVPPTVDSVAAPQTTMISRTPTPIQIPFAVVSRSI